MNNNLISDSVNIQNNKNYRSANMTGKILLAILSVLILTSGVLIGKYFLSPDDNGNTIVKFYLIQFC